MEGTINIFREILVTGVDLFQTLNRKEYAQSPLIKSVYFLYLQTSLFIQK